VYNRFISLGRVRPKPFRDNFIGPEIGSIFSNFPEPSRGSPFIKSVGKLERGSSRGSKIDLVGTIGPKRGLVGFKRPERGPLVVVGSISLSRGSERPSTTPSGPKLLLVSKLVSILLKSL
jgi:hypothetical protein